MRALLLPPDTFLEFTRLITSDLSKVPAFKIKVGVFQEYYTAMVLLVEQASEGTLERLSFPVFFLPFMSHIPGYQSQNKELGLRVYLHDVHEAEL